MTKETIKRMPQKIINRIEQFRKDYKNAAISKEKTRARISGYIDGLMDAGAITEQERKVLFVYCTV